MSNKEYEYQAVFDKVMSHAKCVNQTELVTLDLMGNLLDRVVAEDVCSPLNLPDFNTSAMDGYGFSLSAVENYLPIIETVYAGRSVNVIDSNQAIKIMTGSVVPAGIDCVIPQEYAQLNQTDAISFLKNPKDLKLKRNIKTVGSDVKMGECLLRKGQVIRPQNIALLASVGLAQVRVYQKLKIVILVLGDELVPLGKKREFGQIFESNSWLVAGLLDKLSIELVAVDLLKDDKEIIRSKLKHWGARVDVVITIGGASVGQKDFMKTILNTLPNSFNWKIKMQPAKHFSMAVLSRATVLALPGNPLATFMSFQLFAKTFIKKTSGVLDWQTKTQSVALANEVQVKGVDSVKLQWLQAKKTERGLVAFPKGSSSQLSRISEADGYICIYSEKKYPKGSLVEFWTY